MISKELRERIDYADKAFGPFHSTHEALGVASEEWDELRTAIHANDAAGIRHECVDLAAVLLRLARQVKDSETPALDERGFRARSSLA